MTQDKFRIGLAALLIIVFFVLAIVAIVNNLSGADGTRTLNAIAVAVGLVAGLLALDWMVARSPLELNKVTRWAAELALLGVAALFLMRT